MSDSLVSATWQVLARIVGMGDAAQPPSHFATSPALAIPLSLAHAGLTAGDVDYYEINEAFSVVDIANRQILQLHDERCSPLLALRLVPCLCITIITNCQLMVMPIFDHKSTVAPPNVFACRTIPQACQHGSLLMPATAWHSHHLDAVEQSKLAWSRVNVHGGAVALGHPIGASGAAILVRLINVLNSRNASTGVAAICNGGGGASAVVIQRAEL